MYQKKIGQTNSAVCVSSSVEIKDGKVFLLYSIMNYYVFISSLCIKTKIGQTITAVCISSSVEIKGGKNDVHLRNALSLKAKSWYLINGHGKVV